MKKKIISGLLSLILLLSCYSVAYSAEPITTEDGFVIGRVTVSREEVLAVIGYTGTDTNIKIPTSCRFGDITAIISGAVYSPNLKSVVIPREISFISPDAITGNDTFAIHGQNFVETGGYYLNGVYYKTYKQTAAKEYAKKINHEFIESLDYLITDVDMNGKTDLDDVTRALKCALTISGLNTQQKYFADTNSDGEVTLDDVTKILKVALTIESV